MSSVEDYTAFTNEENNGLISVNGFTPELWKESNKIEVNWGANGVDASTLNGVQYYLV